MEIGNYVKATKLPEDCIYLQVMGTTTAIDSNGYAWVRADFVKDRWAKKWEQHPSSCMIPIKISDLELLEAA